MKQKIILEAGHLYLDQAPDQEQFLGIEIAKKIIANKEKEGHEINKVLFLDDYNIQTPVDTKIATINYLQILKDYCGYCPRHSLL